MLEIDSQIIGIAHRVCDPETGLAIYLAYLGQLARSLLIAESNFAAIVSFAIFAIGFIVITLMVLVKFTAELVDVFLPLRQFFRRGKNIRSQK